jgi:stress response protein SCP2
LYEVPEDFDHVVFDLQYRYPIAEKDGTQYALDASVFFYSGTEFVDLVDYKRRESALCSGVKHIGDKRDSTIRVGHQKIKVSIKSIPSHINRLVFTLSAYNSRSMSMSPALKLEFFDERFPEEALCDERIKNRTSQAIIVCFLSKRGRKWRVIRVDIPSDGNAQNYETLKDSIKELIHREEGSK